MLIKNVFSIAFLATSSLAGRVPGRGCGAPAPSQNNKDDSVYLAELETAALAADKIVRKANVNIPVYVHVVASSKKLEDGYLTNDLIKGQIQVLNSDYKEAGFTFDLKNVDYTVNTNWARDRSEMTMKRALRKGEYGTLNLYFQPYVSGYLGYCYFPESGISKGSTDWYRDGCTILAGTVPGGWESPYTGGRTATHEIGHWLGLYHTFEGDNCEGEGDLIDDTPAVKEANFQCPVGRDSCPKQPGLDAIHNFMDYTDDACMSEFSPGQQTRMQSFYKTYRS